MFGRPMPTFNLNGKAEVKTYTGGVMSVILVGVLIAYGMMKLLQLLDKHNPNLAQYTETNVFDFNDQLNLNDIDFRFAFTIEGYLDQEMKDDPKYIK